MNEAARSATWLEWVTEACSDSAIAIHLVPANRTTLSWAPQNQDVKLAWTLYNELRTRITTQPLPIGYGDEAAALQSLVEFFQVAREAIVQHSGALHASALMVHALNGHIRPFTARWHAKADKLLSLDKRYLFRRELVDLQKTLRALNQVFGALAGDLERESPSLSFAAEVKSGDRKTNDLEYGTPQTGPWAAQIIEMNEAESKFIRKRRGQSSEPQSTPVENVVGLAISGGGLRSATFALGIVQELARRGVMKDIDVMSTVSGGGYIGSFLSCVLSDPNPNVGLAPGNQPFGKAGTAESSSIRHIRNHSKYLAEGGFSTFAHIAFLILYGIAMSLLLSAPTVLIAAVIAIYGFGIGETQGKLLPDGALIWVSSIGWFGLLGSAVSLSVVRSPFWRPRLELMAVVFFVWIAGTLALRLLPDAYTLFAGSAVTYFLLFASVLLMLGTTGIWLGELRVAGRAALMCLALVGPIFFFFAWVLAVDVLSKLDLWVASGVVAGVVGYGWFFLNANFTSLHGFYRGRLARTFLRRADNTASPDPQPLSELNALAKAPLHLLCASLNVPASKSDELRGRGADLFTFSSLYCGGPLIGWRPTTEWEEADPFLDLGTAMAISGAAAAPRMGTLTSVKYTALLALLNVRLGYWLAKPGTQKKWDRVPGGLHFMREITGRVHERLNFLNLSDGGHIENSGIYELLRRRCRYIIAIDGEADPDHTFSGLLNAIRMANIDFGVSISPDFSDLRDGIEPFKRAHFAMTRISYPSTDSSTSFEGLLFIFKLALTGNESELLMRFRQQYPAFPHQSTFQQLFSEAQFEAYRELGQHAAEAAFDPVLLGRTYNDAASWLHCLETSLLPKR